MSESEQILGAFCQNCTTWNPGGQDACRKCGTRLLIVMGDHSWENDLQAASCIETEEDFDEHLLERITVLEESVKRIEAYLETVSEQMGKLERSELMLRNGLLSLVQEMEQKYKLDAQVFSQRWEMAVEDNLQLLSAREKFTRYRPRILAISQTKSVAQLKRALLETAALLDSGQLVEASQRLEEALPIDPKNYELTYSVALLKEIVGDTDRAAQLARRVVQQTSRHYEAWMLIAKIAQSHFHKPDKAIESLRTAIELRPEELEPKVMLAELTLFEGDLQAAFEASTNALETERNGDTLRIMGEVLIERGEYAEAIATLKEASEHQPGEITVRGLLAEGYLHTSEQQKAFAILRDLLSLYPGETDLLIMLDSRNSAELRTARGGNRRARFWLDEAEEWLKEKNLENARNCLRKALNICLSDRASWVELQILAAENIVQALPKLLEFSTSQHHPRLCYNALRVAIDYLMAGSDNETVLRVSDGYLALHPKSTGAWECAVIRQAFLLINGFATESDLAEVKRLYANPLPGHESNVTTLLGQYLLDFNRPQEVIDLVVQRIEDEPTLINHFQLGSALAATGRKLKALEILRMGKNANTSDLQGDQAKMFQERLDSLIRELEGA